MEMVEKTQEKTPPLCQQCQRASAKFRTYNVSTKGYRWKCETCFRRLQPSGFNKEGK
jgi:predicted SprT family Zn-dependent metalloprotease